MSQRELSPALLVSLLETGFGATGQSVSEKLSSVESRLPAPLMVQLRAVFATARQLETGGTVDLSSYRRMLESSAEQLELLAAPRPATQPVPSSQAVPVTPGLAAPTRRLGSPAGRHPAPSRLSVWLYDTRTRIPARAHRLAQVWRLPGTILGLLIGAAGGWFAAGLGGAIAGGLLLAALGFALTLEGAIARSLWGQTRLVEGAFALLRLLGRAALAVLAIVVVGLIVFFVTRFWNVGKP